MKRIKTPLLAAAAIATIGFGAFGIQQTFAAQNTDEPKPMERLVAAIATKFNLNQDEVRAVFEQEHEAFAAEHQAEMQANVETRIDDAVENGKLTNDQANALKAKLAQMEDFRATLKDLDPEARGEAMKAHMEELRAWLEEQNIPEVLGRFGFQVKGRGPHGDMRMNLRTHAEERSNQRSAQ